LNAKHEIISPQGKRRKTITKDIIKSLDVLIAEVSHPSRGEGIEPGWTDCLIFPLFIFSKKR